MKDKLAQLQKICTELHEEYGLTDEVLELQIVINKLGHKHNISDEKNKVYKNYVQ